MLRGPVGFDAFAWLSQLDPVDQDKVPFAIAVGRQVDLIGERYRGAEICIYQLDPQGAFTGNGGIGQVEQVAGTIIARAKQVTCASTRYVEFDRIASQLAFQANYKTADVLAIDVKH